MYAICHFFNQVFLITPGSIAEQMMSKPAVKAFAPVAIFLLQMQQTLRTPCILSLDARHSPLAHYPVALCRKLLKQCHSPLRNPLLSAHGAIGIKQRGDYVDHQQCHTGGRECVGYGTRRNVK